MTVIKCQHSNIEFEATSKRTKQHPLVAEFKNETASRRGDYRLGKEALDKATEIGGYETIQQYMELVQSIYDGSYEAKREAEKEAITREQARKARREQARVERDRLNSFLREHGYQWRKTYTDPAYGAGWGEDDREVWRLFSPDGRIVSVEEAKDEIERGAEVVLAETEAEEQAKLEAKADFNRTIDEWSSALSQAIDGMTETESFHIQHYGMEIIHEYESAMVHKEPVIPVRRRIYRGSINGVTCVAVETTMSDGDSYRYYSADPDEAGIPVKTQKSMLDDFFS